MSLIIQISILISVVLRTKTGPASTKNTTCKATGLQFYRQILKILLMEYVSNEL